MQGNRLEGKIALITGAAQGIGAAHARLFAAEGAKVILGDIALAATEKLAGEIKEAGGLAEAVHLDVASRADWDKAVDRSQSAFGELTTLVNNAGIYHPIGIEEETREGWDRTIATNQTGVFLGMQACIPALKASENGAVVNIASLLGLLGAYKCFAYHASKAAVKMMSKAASLELAPYNIRVNSIYPGSIMTPIIANMSEDERDMTVRTIPLGRWGEPDDIAKASLFLCSDDASYITGAQLSIDGGFYPAG